MCIFKLIFFENLFKTSSRKWRKTRLFVYLILIELAIFIFLFALVLKGDDDKTDEYIDHEKGNDNYVYNIISRYDRSVIVNWSFVFFIRIDGYVEQAEIIKKVSPEISFIFNAGK